MTLTPRQREIYEFVRAFVAAHGYAPSLQEIGAHLGLTSVSTVHKHVGRLVEKGLLRKSAHRARALEPMLDEEVGGRVRLPLLGVVAAGSPIESLAVRDSIEVPAALVRRPERSFVLRVRGDSMIDEQIRDGDYVIVESGPEASDGDTVVALVRTDEVTLKRFERRGDRVRLLPANPAMQPIELPAGEVALQGIVRGLLRRY